MKKLKQIQEENRKFIIMANNPSAKTYEEALEMELGFGCSVQTEFAFTTRLCYKTNPFGDEVLWKEEGGFWVKTKIFDEIVKPKNKKINKPLPAIINCCKIIGKPLTINRVLNALEPYPNNWGIIAGHIANIDRKKSSYDFKCKWDLTKETLEEQSEETQRKINELI